MPEDMILARKDVTDVSFVKLIRTNYQRCTAHFCVREIYTTGAEIPHT
jgi:hypothetical protein